MQKTKDLWKSGQLILCLFKPIIDDHIEVLQRLGLKNERGLNGLLHLFAHDFHSIFSTKTHELHLVEEDPVDDKFIECAVFLNPYFIISRDKAFIAIQDYMGIRIIPPT